MNAELPTTQAAAKPQQKNKKKAKKKHDLHPLDVSAAVTMADDDGCAGGGGSGGLGDSGVRLIRQSSAEERQRRRAAEAAAKHADEHTAALELELVRTERELAAAAAQADTERRAAEAEDAALDAELQRTASEIADLGSRRRAGGGSAPAAGTAAAGPIAVVYDMESEDPDDFLCLLFLASHPRVWLKAVTINPGSTTQVGLVRWALGMLGLGHTPVGAGNIRYPKACVSPWHARAFFGGGQIPPSSDAEEAWRVLLRECDESTTIFTGGALTNIAAAIERGGEGFVVQRFVAQGGFAGDNVVPPEWRLPKFAGETNVPTFNFNQNLGAAHTSLSHAGFGSIWLVSKNVCHSDSNAFRAEHLHRLLGILKARGCAVPREGALPKMRHKNSSSSARHNTGLSLIMVGMREYLSRRGQKLLHDPLAAATLVDGGVISAWREVRVGTQSSTGRGCNRWGSTPAPGSGTHIAVRHDAARFWGVFLGEVCDGCQFDAAPVHEPHPHAAQPEPEAQMYFGSEPEPEPEMPAGSVAMAEKLVAELTRIETLKEKLEAGAALGPKQCSRIATEAQVRDGLARLGFGSPAPRLEVLFAKTLRQEAWLREKAVEGMLKGLIGTVWSGKRTETECLQLAQRRFAEMRKAWEAKERANRNGLAPADQRQTVVAGSAAGAGGSAPPATASGLLPRDWEGAVLPRFVQPAKPPQNEGMKALIPLALDPYAQPPERILMVTAHCVVAYDLYPKGRVHVLILPRMPLNCPDELRPEHEPLLRHMVELAHWLAPRLRAQHPGLPPLRCGFHAVPSMWHLHLHLISIDFDSGNMKHPRHWTIFNTAYLVPPHEWIAQLRAQGRVHVDVAAEKARAKSQEMRCPLTGSVVRTMSDMRRHLRSAAYRSRTDAIETDLCFMSGDYAAATTMAAAPMEPEPEPEASVFDPYSVAYGASPSQPGVEVFSGEHDEEGVWVYQAYSTEIADWAVANQQLGGPRFNPSRMTWFKPSFAWVLYRSGYGRKHNQERVLKLKLGHASLAALLSLCECKHGGGGSKGRVQWDPARDIMHSEDGKVPSQLLHRRAIQVGVRADLSEQFVQAVLAVEDVTALAHQVGEAHRQMVQNARARRQDRSLPVTMEQLLPSLPRERPYRPHCSETVLRELRMLPGKELEDGA